MFLSREIDIKMCQNYTKTHKCKIWYKILNFKQIILSKYATNLKTVSHYNDTALPLVGVLVT